MMIAVIQPPCILYTLFRHFDKELEKTDISNTNLKRELISFSIGRYWYTLT